MCLVTRLVVCVCVTRLTTVCYLLRGGLAGGYRQQRVLTFGKRKFVLRYDSTQVIQIFTPLACLRLKMTYTI